MSSTILSTKILSPSQKSLLLNAGLQFVEYSAIKIEYLDFELPKDDFDAIIFTSQNGVHAFLDKKENDSKMGLKVFCVGEKTRSLLKEKGFQVVKTASSAEQLGDHICSEYPNLSFLLVAGNLRRDELPRKLKGHEIKFKEVIAYHTHLNPKSFDQDFDGVLFFSPSGVISFFEENQIKGTAFCIGETTAQALKKYTKNCIVANRPTVENVLVQAVKYFNSPHKENSKTEIEKFTSSRE